MRVVIQRTTDASVEIRRSKVAEIGVGYVILLGIESADTSDDVDWLCKKIIGLRIFTDEVGKMNKDILEVNGDFLVVSQFTLHAKTKKGNRPSFIHAAKPDVAIPLYEEFKKKLAFLSGRRVESGEFGADMKVQLVNDGPVTILMDTKNKE